MRGSAVSGPATYRRSRIEQHISRNSVALMVMHERERGVLDSTSTIKYHAHGRKL
jgi:hypothetical protein